jgi:hypothetical protein
MPRYHVTMFTPSVFGAAAPYVLAGLFELEQRGEIALDFRLQLPLPEGAYFVDEDGKVVAWGSSVSTLIVEFTVTDLSTGLRARVCCDYRDEAMLFPLRPFDTCDVIFKYHFDPHYNAALPTAHQQKVYPAGLFYTPRHPRAHHLWLMALGECLTAWRRGGWRGVRSPRSAFLAPLNRALFSFERNYSAMRTAAFFETTMRDPAAAPYAFFQTRSFDSGKRDRQAVTEERASLIRALRAALGDRFVGGFMPSEMAQRAYADCITTAPTDSEGYTKLVNQAAVVVYSRGLQGSVARKMAEYLAGGCCIVAQRFSGVLPAPLRDHQEVVYFDTPAECAARCADLLDDVLRRRQMEQRARAYYDEQVEPSAAMRRLISTALAHVSRAKRAPG